MVSPYAPRQQDYWARDNQGNPSQNRFGEGRFFEPFQQTPGMDEYIRTQWSNNPLTGWTRAAMEPTGYRLGAGSPVRTFYERSIGDAFPLLYDLARQGGQGMGGKADDMVQWAQQYLQQLTGQAPEGENSTGLAANTGELADFISGLFFDRENQPGTLQEIYQPQDTQGGDTSMAQRFGPGADMLTGLINAASFGVMSPLRRNAMMQELERYQRDWLDLISGGQAPIEMPFADYVGEFTEFFDRWGIPEF